MGNTKVKKTHNHSHNGIKKMSNSSDNPHRKASSVKNMGGMLRDKATINRLKMYRSGKAVRNKDGKIVGGSFMLRDRAGGSEITGATGRIQPNRRWFGNTRTISQSELDRFREEVKTQAADPYSIILRKKKLPMGLIQDSSKITKMNLVEAEPFSETYGPGSKRKRPKISTFDYGALLNKAETRQLKYNDESHIDSNVTTIQNHDASGIDKTRDDIFDKGQSRRIWGELYKVLDCSDVVIQVLDARDIPGTRSAHLEKHILKNASHKHLIFVINKCDLVPTWCVRKWVRILSKERPTIAFHASITNSFGKGSLINLLRQYAKLHADKKQISVGIVGYPNVGKSSLINTLKAKNCCKTAPIPGETKVWQYITLMKRIFLIDCPGVVYDVGDSEADIVLKGVVRAEKLSDPPQYIATLLSRVKREHIVATYGIHRWDDCTDFLSQLAIKNGRLGKGGTPDLEVTAVSVLNDFQRGNLPHFVAPPMSAKLTDEEEEEQNGEEDILKDENSVNDEEGEEDEEEIGSELNEEEVESLSDYGNEECQEIDDDDDAVAKAHSKKQLNFSKSNKFKISN